MRQARNLSFFLSVLFLGLTGSCGTADDSVVEGAGSSLILVQVPEGRAVREYQPEALAVGTEGQGGFDSVADIRLYTTGPEVGFTGFDDFVGFTLRNMCAADGPGASIHCGEVRAPQPFEARSGLEGDVFYLERIQENLSNGARRVGVWGPIFVFDVSDGSGGHAALVVQPPANVPEESVDSELLRTVADSVRMSARD